MASRTGAKVGPGEWVDSLAGTVVIGSVSAVALVIVAVAVGWSPALPAFVALAAVLAALARIDLREHRIPKRIVHHAMVSAIPLLALASTAELSGTSLVRAGLAAGASLGFYLLLELVYPAGMGRGDVRLAPYIGAHLGFLGWDVWLNAVLATFLLMAFVGLVLLITGVVDRKSRIPHAPFMATGSLAAAVWGLGV